MRSAPATGMRGSWGRGDEATLGPPGSMSCASPGSAEACRGRSPLSRGVRDWAQEAEALPHKADFLWGPSQFLMNTSNWQEPAAGPRRSQPLTGITGELFKILFPRIGDQGLQTAPR